MTAISQDWQQSVAQFQPFVEQLLDSSRELRGGTTTGRRGTTYQGVFPRLDHNVQPSTAKRDRSHGKT